MSFQHRMGARLWKCSSKNGTFSTDRCLVIFDVCDDVACALCGECLLFQALARCGRCFGPVTQAADRGDERATTTCASPEHASPGKGCLVRRAGTLVAAS